MRRLSLVFCTALTLLFLVPILAQDEATPEPTPAPKGNDAVEFLKQIEAKNKDIETLWGKFHQLRVNPMFMEEVESNGEFWYTKPNHFRADYFEPSEIRFYMFKDAILSYTPSLQQVEKYPVENEDSAPINQLLVGFGVETERILDVFNVRMAEKQPEDENLVSIAFVSRDVERTMGYQRITVTFDRKKLEPKEIFLEEEQDTVTVTLQEVKFNAKIPPETYEPDWGDDVEVITY
ncbi:outer membrane lipoprotein carrier protein LolA [bacterium]|nr:outer membrane lipoprotein carrier protein LolA [bacterium]